MKHVADSNPKLISSQQLALAANLVKITRRPILFPAQKSQLKQLNKTTFKVGNKVIGHYYSYLMENDETGFRVSAHHTSDSNFPLHPSQKFGGAWKDLILTSAKSPATILTKYPHIISSTPALGRYISEYILVGTFYDYSTQLKFRKPVLDKIEARKQEIIDEIQTKHGTVNIPQYFWNYFYTNFWHDLLVDKTDPEIYNIIKNLRNDKPENI